MRCHTHTDYQPYKTNDIVNIKGKNQVLINYIKFRSFKTYKQHTYTFKQQNNIEIID